MTRRPASTPAEIAAEQVSFAYPGCPRVLDGAALSAVSGSVTMIVGRSGSGKTTLLKLLQGLLKPSGGSVRRSAATVTSYIPQGLGLVRNHTALQNVLAGSLARVGALRSVLGAFPAPVMCEARALLDRVGLAHKEHEVAGNLSGGERQRVAIARCLLRRPDFVLADEFVSQLDAVTSLEMLELVRQTAASGIGWIITTHDLDVAAGSADRVVALKNGRVVFDHARPVRVGELLEKIQ
jgi:phosphonate transport system ATP-binding protein